MKTFSYRYKSWFGVEGQWDSAARTGSLNIVVLGALIGINLGVKTQT